MIRVDDRGYRALMAKVAEMRGHTVIRAGIFEGGERREGELTNAEIGAIQEFGLGHEPERSFIRATVDLNAVEIHRRLRETAGGIFDFRSHEDVRHEAALFGEWFVGEVKKRIREHIQPENAPSTIEHKGSSTPLIDSGQLLSAITYAVELRR